jgi:GT2 family glycosyltransferase
MVPVEHDWAKVLIPTKRIERYRKVSGLSGRLRHPSGTAGGNLFVRTNVFKKLEGYDEELGPGATFHGVEDGDLEYRALVAGVNVLEDPDSEVLHWGARDYESGAARELQYRYAFSIGAFMMKHIRCLDPVAPLIFTRFAFGQLRRVLPSLILGRRPSGAGFLVHFFQGFWKARPWPLDRRMRRFRSS